MAQSKYDVVVIGGGPAGYVAAIKAAQLGARTALVEKARLGGTCLNQGCIPTKHFVRSAELIHEIAQAKNRGLHYAATDGIINMVEAQAAKKSLVATLVKGVGSLLKSNGITVYQGQGVIREPGVVEVSGNDELGASSIILAGGSVAAKIPIPGINSTRVLTSDQILELTEIPRRLAIIGGGVIGVEMACIFQAFGSEVTIVELADTILPGLDQDSSTCISKALKERGVRVLSATRLERIEDIVHGVRLVTNTSASIEADLALLSIGRQADLSALGTFTVQLEKGRIVVNEAMETSIPGIFAPGDINGTKMLAHAAFKMGEIAACGAALHAGIPVPEPLLLGLEVVPAVVYALPEAAGVGLTEVQARELAAVSVGIFPFSANGRALANGAPEGFVKVIADKHLGKILGIHIVGMGASEMINEAAVLLSMEITAHEAAEIIHGHPTMSEALMEAAADCLGKCIHLPRRHT